MLSNGSHEGILRVGNIGVGKTGGSIDLGARRITTWVVSCSRDVWVVGFEADSVSLDVLEGIVHKTSVASMVGTDTFITTDQLLLRE